MGEYALHANERIKIGTCEDMFYLRLEDRAKVEPVPNSLNPAQTDGLRFRLPYPDEDAVPIGHYQPYNRGVRLCQTTKDAPGRVDWTDPATVEDAGSIQLSHPSGLLINVRCYHGIKLPTGGGDIVGIFWNGKSHSFEMTAVKPDKGQLYGIVSCRHCLSLWRYPLADLLEWVPDTVLRQRLAAYLESTS